MKIVVIGGTGLVGSQVVTALRGSGHAVLAASPNTGVNAVTGEGLADALSGASVVVDVANSPSFADAAAMDFFVRAGRNLAQAEKAAGVSHHVALSVVGTELLLDSGYFRARLAQEELIASAGVPWTLVRATQFFEFVGTIAGAAIVDGVARVTSASIQPIASADVAAKVATVALAAPRNGMIEIAGPERLPMAELVRRHFDGIGDPRAVITDDTAPYFGVVLEDRWLTPSGDAWLSEHRFGDWLSGQPRHAT
ncbi:SDR family oxidoreductase [Methylobacterium sp. ARG-1]|uniref:SDR family oxidoreductase n=1 Tax=Methylobacterium sp. ARG-1 TaxID=1692501 RepID=UPI0006817503|nr:SDR family oxidoreductase [Methylobacterium sp. ARG-1]KNY21030.1 NmrA family transcriptional regulator [Methylobacterium sp. ARG-1]